MGEMEEEPIFHDPLKFNIQRQKTRLVTKFPSLSTQQLSNAELSRLLSVPAFTRSVATLFRPILFDLCARFLLKEEEEDDLEDELVALCLLIQVHEELFPILHQLLLKPQFSSGPLQRIQNTVAGDSNTRIHRLLLAYFRILSANRELPSQLLWSLSPLYTLGTSIEHDTGTRLLAIRCYALQSGMGEAEREKWEKKMVGRDSEVDCPLNYGVDESGNEVQVDGWLLPVLEYQRVRDARNALVDEPQGFYEFEGDENEQVRGMDDSVLCPLTANIYGVFLLRSGLMPMQHDQASSLIPTPTAIRALRSLALHLSNRVPILLTSPPSSGKALFISHLAQILFPQVKNQIVVVQLADTSLDPRSLVGNYVSSVTQPGVFEWKEGVIVRAMREGKWIVLKDIDRASNDVLGLLKPLVESLGLGKWIGGRAAMDVPGHGRVVAADSFAVFGTRSTMPGRSGFPAPTFFGVHKFHEVVVPSPSADELRSIVDIRFQRLVGSAGAALIRMWEAVRGVGSTSSTRGVGLKDLEKYCTRVEGMLPASQQTMDVDMAGDEGLSLSAVFPNLHTREEMYLAARDVYFGEGALTTAARAHMQSIAQIVGEHLGLDTERCEWLLNNWKPEDSEFGFEKDVNGVVTAVRMKRARIQAKPPTKLEVNSTFSSRPFAMHRPATVLLSRIVTAVSFGEPILLTGETGTGKTSVITHLANTLRQPLVSLNLSHQTESSDLLGGFRPVDTRIPGNKLFDQWLDLFVETFSRKKNEAIEKGLREAVQKGKWKQAVNWWKGSVKKAKEQIQKRRREFEDPSAELDSQNPRKRRKLDASALNASEEKWSAFEQEVDDFNSLHVEGKGRFAFAFLEGPLVKALRTGDWVLLDEINLASPETLECISSILQSPTASITLTEQGSLEPVPRHPNFRLFACMNPATDVGKKDLPPNIRSRFTEIDVPPPDADHDTLLSIVEQYIGHCAVGDKKRIHCVAEFYLAVKKLAETRQIVDGSNHRPHFSMRTLARALTFAADIAQAYSLRRAIWEGCMMAFTMVLDTPSARKVVDLAKELLLPEVKSAQLSKAFFTKEPSSPEPSENFVKFGPFYLEKGPLPEDPVDDYIMTPSVHTKLTDLARIILTRRFPVLIEGPTSSGKTSAVEYLAKRTGHRFIRINNHDHTDIQEYLGSYVSDPQTGKLVFTDGLLVRALRNGDWIVLDELNLAPTDVLEALNRLLDDNRELVIPETGEVIKPHPHFMLFATQNPPGLYAGRKVLSRAFRNRFLEVHFEDVPEAELQVILCEKCRIAPSRAEKIVAVFRELQKRRQSGRVFESKHGFATLRDLFRWGERQANSDQELAEDGYMLLAERARREDDKVAVKEVIESIMRAKLDEKALYDLDKVDLPSYLGIPYPSTSNLVWTTAMKRLFILVSRALRFNEPVLLVGETGCGKTSVCQEFALAVNRELHALNCHQNTETADMIGGLRPVRNRGALEAEVLREVRPLYEQLGGNPDQLNLASAESFVNDVLRSDTLDVSARNQATVLQQKLARAQSIFEWHDGPLVEAMKRGDVFLLDEISLADDSVLERLNSVLEPSRTIVLAEKGGDVNSVVQADPSFKLVATMNPGGDYGKKELSPALRNRFTEIWVPAVDSREDLELIVTRTWKHGDLEKYTTGILDFVEWLCQTTGDRSFSNLRDILAWVTFSNSMYNQPNEIRIPPDEIFHHAAHMTFLDGLASVPSLGSYSSDSFQKLKASAIEKLRALVPVDTAQTFVPSHNPQTFFQLGSFAIPRGPRMAPSQKFNFQAPTSQDNAMRVVRACQLGKPILLEGSPGVGKTSLIVALAAMAGHSLCRINLSDQTDIIDLFGSDLPVEGGGPGEFAWKDGEFLKALQEGSWVLLDEMNLAPQAVLEGLNAVLDHRGTVYIPELGRSFVKHPSFRIFAAQNPLSQGGGRKGLPKSFMNRFTKVYVEQLSAADLVLVCHHYFPDIDRDLLQAMVTFNSSLNDAVSVQKAFAREGSPWEFNLRDVLRWCSLIQSSKPHRQPVEYLRPVYLHRFRNEDDRRRAQALFNRIFGDSDIPKSNPSWSISTEELQVGVFHIDRRSYVPLNVPKRIVRWQLSALEAMGCCLSQSWLSILTGPRHSGKTSLVRLLAHLTGHQLQEIAVNSATDTMDILGGFEQIDPRSRILSVVEETLSLADEMSRSFEFVSNSPMGDDHLHLRRALEERAPQLESTLETAKRLLGKVAQVLPDGARVLQEQISDLDHGRGRAGRFEWVDGPLVKAMKDGRWLLLDGANLCNPSVLDRLNSLCEENGALTLSERGFVDGEVQVLRPAPGFRLFMAVDPQHGELSRAMRNRGIEIALMPDFTGHDCEILRDYCRLPSSLGPDTPKLSYQFSGIRRATFDRLDCSSTATSTSGRALDHYSSLSPLLDQAPAFTSSDVETKWNALQNYLSRSVPPSSIPSYIRFFSSTGLDAKLETMFREVLPRIDTALVHFRGEIANINRIGSSHAAALPMDPYLFLPVHADAEVLSMHLNVLKVLEIFVITASEEFQNTEKVRSPHYQEQGVVHRATLAVDSLTSEIATTSRTLLETSLATPFAHRKSLLQDMSLAGVLLKYSRRLRSLIAGPVFDFSSVQTISRWILDASESFSTHEASLVMCAKTLHDITSLSSGLGLNEIWKVFLQQSTHQHKGIERLERLASMSSSSEDLRGQVFNLMSVASLGVGDESVTEQMTQSLEQRLPETKAIRIESSVTRPHLLSTVSLLGLLVRSDVSESLRATIERLLAVVRQQPAATLRRMVPFQHFLWLHDTGIAALAPSFQIISLTSPIDSTDVRRQLQFCWMKQLWPSEEEFSPADLLSAASLRSVFSIFDWSRIRLSDVSDYDSTLKAYTQLCLVSCEQNQPRTEQIATLLRTWIDEVSSWFLNPGEKLGASGSTNASSILQGFPDKFTKHPGFISAVETHLHPNLHHLGHERETRTATLRGIGLCWIAISRTILDLFIPDVPVDPVAVQNFSRDFWEHEQSSYSAELELHLRLEELVTSNQDSHTITYIRQSLDEANRNVAEYPFARQRRDVHVLHKFWAEVLQFRKQVLSHSRLDSLLDLFATDPVIAQRQEDVVQRSIAGFSQRLESVYKEFVDILVPIQHAFLGLQLGLRMIRRSSVEIDLDTRSAIVLSAFPSIRGSELLLSQPERLQESEGLAAFQRLLLSVASVGLQLSAGVYHPSRFSQLNVIYDQAFRLWRIDQAKVEEKEKSSQSLYRNETAAHQALSDAEIEQAEFLELFPSFESVLTEEMQAPAQRKAESFLVSEAETRKLVVLHESICFYDMNKGEGDAFTGYDDVRTELLSAVLNTASEGLTDYIDRDSLALQLRLLDRRTRLLQNATADEDGYNFYVHANVPQATKAVDVVSQLKLRLHSIIQEFPDQMVLHHLETRCSTFLVLDLHSPLAKILSALEQLLLQTEDWEIYANKDNTLKANRSAMTDLIVEWRRLELSSWRALLENQAREFEGGVSVWWFRLYDALIRGPLDARARAVGAGGNGLADYLDSLIPLLDDFIKSAPLGQFRARLRLLRSFEVYCHRLVSLSAEDTPVFETVEKVVHATVGYFGLFSDALAARLSTQRSALESEVLDLIRLASWKDINVHALKQSAQRTHHQLYKIVRRFRDVLRQPIVDQLLPSSAANPETHLIPLETNHVLSTPSEEAEAFFDSVPGNLIRSKNTFAKFSHLVHSRIRPFIVSKNGDAIDNLATEIITTSKELAETAVPMSLPADKREKHSKSLLNRKRKAWSDLLKELKSAGFSPNVKSEVLRQNSSVRWIREQPMIPGASLLLGKGENYLYRLNGAFPSLRDSLSSHHSDLGTRELQKGIMFLESAFSIAMESRSWYVRVSLFGLDINGLTGAFSLARMASSHVRLERTFRRVLASNSSGSIVFSGPTLTVQLVQISDIVVKLVSTLREIAAELETYARLNPTHPVLQNVSESCRTILANSYDVRNRVLRVVEDVGLSLYPVLLLEEHKAIIEGTVLLDEVIASLRAWSDTEPRLSYLFSPAADWLVTFSAQCSLDPHIPPPSDPGEVDSIISACLVTVQGLLPKCQQSETLDDRDDYIREHYRDIRGLAELLKIEPMVDLTNKLLLSLATRGSGYQADLQRVIPYLDMYTKLVQAHLDTHSHFNAAFFKLNFVLCSILQTLSKQGFCRPPDETSDDGGAAEGTAEMTDGVGMGEGSGNQNVSKEIEEESQVEGLKGEKAEEGQGPEDKDDDAIEMDQDFDGEMQDVPEEGEREDGDDEKSEGSDADPEEQIGDLDISDPAAVDEKLWGDEEGPQDSDQTNQKTNEDHSTTKGKESETVAKEGGERSESKEKTDQSEQEAPPEDEPQPVEEEEEESEMPGLGGAPMDEHVPEADTLDLPDDIDMNAGEDPPDERDMDMSEDGAEPETEPEQPAEDSSGVDHHQEPPPQEPDQDDLGAEDDTDIPVAAPGESDEGGQDEEQENSAVAQPDISTGDGNPNDDFMDPEAGASNQGGQKGTSTGVAGEDSSMTEAEASEEKETREAHSTDNAEQVQEPQADPSQAPGAAATGTQQGPQRSQQSSQLASNPLRSLGDALKEVQQRFDEILSGEERDMPREQLANAGDPSQVEYLRPNDTDHDMQALGPSEEEQASKLKDLQISEHTNDDTSVPPMDIDVEMGDIDVNLQPAPSHDRLEVEQNSSGQEENVEGAIVHDPYSSPSQARTEAVINLDGPKADIDMEEDTAGPAVEAELRSWQSDGLPDSRAEHIWRLYESLTHDLAYALCEQLRLILEPTLATRLKGDYRTGKRLNMKKIIPYIASDYTKDKIWLRRTRPSQREYQVLIALDDSKSMAESHSVHLAYQTLALVSKALGRLEAGDIGIARFGEAVEVLHGFEGAPFTDQAGVEVMKAFHFNQKATNVLSLVDTSLRVLEAARERRAMSSSTAADLWQLEIIISDGMCQDHEKLRPILRKAEEQKVMIVFIIIDSLHSSPNTSSQVAHGSILSMTKAEIVNVNGKMDMQIQRYLDSFPFEYYVVLRNVEALPEVLSATLKQFFERISEE
ncbi:AAA ATPase midasin [Marasmius crinis-equi]|uniref:Midasin n=1 Tax=Marasmius crinis-equi TaxID=585013 RepID=A0ABR3FUK3_9AGAR